MTKFNIKSMKPIFLKKNKNLYKNDPRDFFKNQNAVAKALSEALLEGDKEAFQEIIIGYLGIINKEELARISKLPIATIRRVAAGSNYNIETLLKITAAIRKAA
jgi:predicted transcriptional regulator